MSGSKRVYRSLARVLAAGAAYQMSPMAYAAVEAAQHATVMSSTAAAIRAAPFAEPLIAVKPTSDTEDRALLAAIAAYQQRNAPDDFSALLKFLSDHSQSGWAAGLRTNLGLGYLHYGYFSRADEEWQKAWAAGKVASTPAARALVDRAIGERARLLASLGQFDKLEVWFTEIGTRPITGSATESIQTAREQLTLVKKDPRHLFNCGPLALRALLQAQGVATKDAYPLTYYNAGPNGTSLAEVGKLAQDYKLGYRLIFRQPGQPIPDKAIVHWKVGHFAAIVGRKDGRIEIEDPVFPGNRLWITQTALDAEASGYFLVPSSSRIDPTWRTVVNREAASIWGKGPTNGSRPGDPGDPPARRGRGGPGSAGGPGGPGGAGGPGGNGGPGAPGGPDGPKKDCPLCAYNIAEASVAITLSDTPVGYDPPIGPSVQSVIAYSQREDSQPANFNFFNVGQKWTLNWLSYVTDDPTLAGATVSRFMRGGSAFYYDGYVTNTGRFKAQDTDGAVLVLKSQSPVTYELQLPDGGMETYSTSDGSTSFPRRIFLSSVADPQGNKLLFNYDAQRRLTSLTDATGRQTTFSYGIAAQPLQVTKITDPFGRSAVLGYDSNNRLTSITDIIGLKSQFTYDANSLVSALTTPYGTTTFAYTAPGASGPPRFAEVTDPLGNHERVEWLEPSSNPASDPSNTVPQGMPLTPTNNYLNYRNSFYWDKDAYVAAGCTPTGGCDYTKARNTHFLHFNGAIKSTTIESIKEPLENRVWFAYPGQTSSSNVGTFSKPSATGRVLDDGTTQLSKIFYDSAGYYNPTQVTDPLGRTTSFSYSNGIDLAAVSQKTTNGNVTTIAQYSYNTKHRPITYVDAAGQLSLYTYNTVGQILTATDPLGRKTQYQYTATADLLKVVNAHNADAVIYTYDAYARVATMTDSEGWTVAYSYDAADRMTSALYPDGTSEEYTYDKLNLVAYRDRLARTWRYSYDANGNMTVSTDPSGKQMLYSYSGEGRVLSMTDPDNNVTSWTYDVQGRPTIKKYADNSTVTYTYETTTSRLKSQTDALGQIKQNGYALDDRLSSITYLNAVNSTPNVSYAYDPYFPRLASMTDGTGTRQYSYGAVGDLGALQLKHESGPLPSSNIEYTYDELGRVVSRTIQGSTTETYGYDTLDRPISHGSALGSFTMSYLGQTGQITQLALAGTTLQTNWNYLNNLGDRRLREIANIGLSSGKYSTFDYATNAEDMITGSTESSDAATVYPTAMTQTASYNNLNQLTTLSGQSRTYDAVGNLTADGTRTYSWDAESRLIGIGYPGQPSKATAFTYDGLSRRISIANTPAGGGSAVTVSYVWCGSDICQARDATNAVTRQYLAEGEYVPGSPGQSYFYGIDRIGTVRRVFASIGSTPAYAFDPYGVPLQSTAPLTDLGYAGMFQEQASGLALTQFRAYDPNAGRWISRDPLGEQSVQGANLYEYVGGNPINRIDPDGRFWFLAPLAGAVGGAAFNVATQGIGLWIKGCDPLDYRNYDISDIVVSAALGATIPGPLSAAGKIFGRYNLLSGAPRGLNPLLYKAADSATATDVGVQAARGAAAAAIKEGVDRAMDDD